uniref:ZP domain-containing protein n=1 Tax=Cacopsylla melanoneura TaxID=428564 RepID=A0A8D9F324_9HEMI
MLFRRVQTGIHADNTHNLPSSITPHAHLRIVDIQHGGLEASETQLGQDLELAIDIEPPFNVSMVRAGHLVASSGDGRDSLLLLDYRGCPPDPRTFPALTPHPDPGVNALSAIFKAFRFPSSPILRFSLVLTFCETVCQPIDCGNGLESYGKRKRRQTQISKPERFNSSTTSKPLHELHEEQTTPLPPLRPRHKFENATDENNIRQKVPLQLAIIVRPLYEDAPAPLVETTNELHLSDGATSRQISALNDSNTVCMEWTNVLIISLVWLCVQFSFLICCCYVLYCRPKYKKQHDEDSLAIDFQPRHVTWASDSVRTRH